MAVNSIAPLQKNMSQWQTFGEMKLKIKKTKKKKTITHWRGKFSIYRLSVGIFAIGISLGGGGAKKVARGVFRIKKGHVLGGGTLLYPDLLPLLFKVHLRYSACILPKYKVLFVLISSASSKFKGSSKFG